MNISEILLIIVSSAGLIHGILFATYLCFFKKKTSLANMLLGLILLFMALRIGKSVMLYFGKDLEPTFIFAGLALLLLIGPLVRWYVLAMTTFNYKLSKYAFLETVPFFGVLIASFFITNTWFTSESRDVIILFASAMLFIYIHLICYIIWSWLIVIKKKKTLNTSLLTKSQKVIFSWLKLLIIGFVIIWVSYCLNIIEDTIPYILGPIVYSITIYLLSYKAFDLSVTDINGDVFKVNDDAVLFKTINDFIINEKGYLDIQLSLTGLGNRIGKSPQKTSEIINQYAQKNFNDYINYFRIQDAKQLLLKDSNKNYTIASVAYDVGFSSLSTFNSAFKKFEKTTPSNYRKEKG